MIGFRLCLTIVCLFVVDTAIAQDTVAMKANAKKLVERMNVALAQDNFSTVVDLTHPNVHKMMGGRENMIKVLKVNNDQMKADGFAFESFEIGEPDEPMIVSDQSFLIVPFVMEMKLPDGHVRLKSFVIGVSEDKGTNWVFLNGDIDRRKLKRVLPELPDSLKLPEKQKPEIRKD
jgi:hypothetical protein